MVKYSLSEPHRAYLVANEVPLCHWINDDDKIIDLLNELDTKLRHTRAENTKNKLIFNQVVEDLENQANSQEPIIIRKDYVDWIKKEANLSFGDNLKDKLFKKEKIFKIIDNKISILEHDLEQSVKAGMPTGALHGEIDLLEELKEELKEELNE